MAPRVQHKRSAVAGKAPQPADLEYGEIGVNYEASDPALYVKDSANAIRKISPQVDATTSAKGVVQLATGAEVTTGTDAVKAVTPATLKTELDKKANLASPALTGVPTAPTAAPGTNTTQLATTAFVNAATPSAADFAPATHVGAGGAAHALVTSTVAGFMSAADKTKLDAAASAATVSTLVLRNANGDASFNKLTAAVFDLDSLPSLP